MTAADSEHPRHPDWPAGYDPYAILDDPHAHPRHKVIAAVNIGIVKHGERWSKCCECGNLYRLTGQWDNPVACCDAHLAAYYAYVRGNPVVLP